MTNTVWNIISSSAYIILSIGPLILYLLTHENIHLVAYAGIIITYIISEFLKHTLFQYWKRPFGACDCNFWNNDGNQELQPGMPSSHTALTTFISIFYGYISGEDNWIYIAILWIYAILVYMSRYIKQCHSIYQIISGALLGGFIAFIWIMYVPI